MIFLTSPRLLRKLNTIKVVEESVKEVRKNSEVVEDVNTVQEIKMWKSDEWGKEEKLNLIEMKKREVQRNCEEVFTYKLCLRS